MREAPLARRRRYRPSLLTADYLIVRGLARYLDGALRAHVRSGDRVADVGCGEQPLRDDLEALGAVYTGIDVAQNSAGKVEVLAPAHAVPLPDASFDVVLCTEVLEHVPDARAAVRELMRLVRPGGVVIVTIPFVYRLHEVPHDHGRYTTHQVRSWAEETGARVEDLRVLGDSVQSLATVWGGIWEAWSRGGTGLLARAWRALCRIPVLCGNVAAAVVVAVAGRALPADYPQSVAAVLRRPDAGAVATGGGA